MKMQQRAAQRDPPDACNARIAEPIGGSSRRSLGTRGERLGGSIARYRIEGSCRPAVSGQPALATPGRAVGLEGGAGGPREEIAVRDLGRARAVLEVLTVPAVPSRAARRLGRAKRTLKR